MTRLWKFASASLLWELTCHIESHSVYLPPGRGDIPAFTPANYRLYSIYRPRKDKKLSLTSWLICSGRFTHNIGHRSAAGRAQDSVSLPARD